MDLEENLTCPFCNGTMDKGIKESCAEAAEKELERLAPKIKDLEKTSININLQIDDLKAKNRKIPKAVFLSIGEMIISGVVNTFGTNVVASYTTGNRISQFASMAYFVISEAFAVYVTQNFGACKFDRIREGFKSIIRRTNIKIIKD